MYSKRAKYKQVADIDWFGENLMETLAKIIWNEQEQMNGYMLIITGYQDQAYM